MCLILQEYAVDYLFCAEQLNIKLNSFYNKEARSRSHCCYGKTVSIKHSECVLVFLI